MRSGKQVLSSRFYHNMCYYSSRFYQKSKSIPLGFVKYSAIIPLGFIRKGAFSLYYYEQKSPKICQKCPVSPCLSGERRLEIKY